LLTAVLGTVLAACSCGFRSPFRALGISAGYVIAGVGFLAASIIASQA
jgi:hypothetical protein